MKKKIKGIVCLMSAIVIVAFMASSAKATPYTIDMHDGNSDNIVNVSITDVTPGYEFGYEGLLGFKTIVVSDVVPIGFATFSDGEDVRFGIRDNSNSHSYYLDTDNSFLEFSSQVPGTGHYGAVSINWDFDSNGTWDVGYSIATAFNSGDGFSLHDNGSISGNSTAVPEPGTLVLLGSGLVGLFILRRKKHHGPEA